MKTFLQPAVLLMSRLRYSVKFTLIGVLAGIPLGLALFFLVSELNAGIRNTRSELRGLDLAADHSVVLVHLTDHAFLSLTDRPLSEKTAHRRAIAGTLDRLKTSGAATGSLPSLSKGWRDIVALDGRGLPERLSDQHLLLYENILNGYDDIGATYHLASDEDVAGFHLVHIVLTLVPERFALIAEISALTWRVFLFPNADVNARIRLAALAHRLKANLDDVNRSLELAFRNRPLLKPPLQQARRSNHIATIRLVNFILESVVYAPFPGQPGNYRKFVKNREGVVGASGDLNDAVIPLIRGLLEERLDGFLWKRGLILGVTIVVAAVILYLFVGFYFNVTRTVATLGQVADQFVSGQLKQRYEFQRGDELAEIGQSFNQVGVALLDAKSETDEILRNVEEGLFLIDPEYSIGNQFSARTAELFGGRALAGANFLTLISGRVPDKTLDSSRKFLGQLFQTRVKEDFLKDLNPLSEVELFDPQGEVSSRHLNLKFNRVMSNGHVPFVMATARDVTEEVLLARKLKAAEEKNTRAMERLFRIIHVDPELLREFIEDCDVDLAGINKLLRREKSPSELRSVLEQSFRVFHSIKGNATILNLDFIVQDIHDLEERIQELMDRDSLEGRDFLPLALAVSGVGSQIDEIRELVERLLAFQTGYRQQPDSGEIHSFLGPLRSAAFQIAEEAGQQVEFDTREFDSGIIANMNRSNRKLVRDVLVQLMRNSLKHGIETPEERAAAGKSEAATIAIGLARRADEFVLRFRDDGRGLDLDALKKRAASTGVAFEGSDEAASRLVFESGISTARETDLLAGRGVGMDAVRENLRAVGGEIQVSTETGRFCEFTIVWPADRPG